MQRAVPPAIDVNVGPLVPFADGGRGDLAAPQGLGDILHSADGRTGQIHLNERFLHAAFPAAIAFNDGCLKRRALAPRHMQCDVAGGGGEVTDGGRCGSFGGPRCARNGLPASASPPRLPTVHSGVSSMLSRTNSLICLTSSFSCTIFLDMVYSLLSECCVATSFYQNSANHVSFYTFSFLRNLLYFISQFILPYRKRRTDFDIFLPKNKEKLCKIKRFCRVLARVTGFEPAAS